MNTDRKKVVFELDVATNSLYDAEGSYYGVITLTHKGIEPILYREAPNRDIALQLIKAGVTVDEIIKLKNNELI